MLFPELSMSNPRAAKSQEDLFRTGRREPIEGCNVGTTLTQSTDMLILALGLGLITAVANVLGSALAVMQRRPSRKFTAATLGFSGGFILAAALMEMMPASLERGAAMPGFVALGYLVVFLIEQFLNVHLHTLPDENNPSVVPVAAGFASLIAFNVHDFVDGLAMGAGMIAETRLGMMVFLAVVLHEIPAGFVIAAIMRGAGWGRWAAIAAGGSLGVITLVGIVLPFWAQGIDQSFSDALLALATGTFIYLGATLLVPLSEAGKSRSITLLVVLGFIAFWATSRLVGH
jgi:zinc transporter ZupT